MVENAVTSTGVSVRKVVAQSIEEFMVLPKKHHWSTAFTKGKGTSKKGEKKIDSGKKTENKDEKFPCHLSIRQNLLFF